MKKLILIIVLIAFGILTGKALMDHGIIGLFEHQFANFSGIQVFFDLVIALVLFSIWMWADAKKNNRSPWPWFILTLLTGSFGPLIYLLVYSRARSEE